MNNMSMTVDQIVEEIRALPQDAVADLVDRVLLESHGGQNTADEQAWSSTVHRRINDIRTGKVDGIPSDETAAKIRNIVGR
ncbi:addiction module antitoxin RelB [Synoicihabitans lomoniglobus]|uniref:Addiction module antitoxin RelB n=1 Tax=Synoicihabitans lomoniglobus TaxID=2909285 RepID=A0AAF0CNI3_9BACT|nr:addiction module antitoxin RelB [Opitutaceae bacterium LMO-M01]WED64581.1 addiction module antitoxin RelB [Opitutaceae bacterium LMO-M01]